LGHITIEYMIMIPILILQIFLFPFLASAIMNTYTESRMTLELSETAGHLSSFMQQIYFSLSDTAIATGTIRVNLDTPALIENHPYAITLHNATSPGANSKIMNITLSFIGAKGSSSTLVTLGENADWQNNSRFLSNSTSPVICASRTSGLIHLSFEGGS
jgi:hypothetical protein